MAGTVWTSDAATNNPIQWVKTSTTGTAKYVKCPSAYAVEVDDISNPDAGRTASGTMVKSQLYVGGKAVRAKALQMEWAYTNAADVAGLMSVFEQAEYLYVRYFDPALNDYTNDWFYIGNRIMPMYNMPMKLWTSFSMKLISKN